MAVGSDEALLGRTIAGKFVIDSFLGGGAMGAVYKAKQTALNKVVAVKVMHKEGFGATFGERFKREAQAASKLDHPNSLRVIDFGEEPDGLLYIAMEYLAGRDLGHVIDNEWPIAPERSVNILSQALAALAVAHEMGIVHRDIKPENIMVLDSVNDEGHPTDLVKVCDFGIAKSTDPGTEGRKLTTEGLVVGTPDYMSPEQARGEDVDSRSDLYSMGVILYQLLAGRAPFTAETALGVALKHVTEIPAPPSKWNRELDPILEDVCLKALEKKPEDRFQTAREMRNALRAAVGAHVGAIPPSSLDRKTRQSMEGAATAVALDGNYVQEESRRIAAVRAASQRGPAADTMLAPAQTMKAVATTGSTPETSTIAVTSAEPPRKSGKGPLVLLALGLAAGAAGAFVLVKKTQGVAPAAPATTIVVVSGTAPASSASSPSTAPATAQPTTDPTKVTVVATEAPTKPTGAPTGTAVAPTSTFVAPTATLTAPTTDPVPTAATTAPTATATAVPTATVTATATTTAAPTATAPPPEPLVLDAAKVSFGSASATNGLSGSNVKASLNLAGITRCYKDALKAKGSPVGGTATLSMAIDDTGHVTSASLGGAGFLPAMKGCVEGIARSAKVKGVDTGDATATVSLTFSPK
ncbi:MAG: serine/threonine protein kinase [Myxococcales bacterium]|nr:serine/threonine protein kinase [Myxococcales bacterium]